MTGRTPVWLFWLPALILAAAIFALSSQSTLPSTPDSLSDKHLHALAYGALALACLFGLTRGRMRALNARLMLIAVLMATAYGASDEIHQAFVPGRTPDLLDLAADATGAAAAASLGWGCAILLAGRDPRA